VDQYKTTKAERIAFFTEAGASRGMGHLVRSFAICETFQSLGLETQFFLDSDVRFDDRFNDIYYFKWESFEIEKDNYDIVVIDSYEASLEKYVKISNACKVAVYLDDFKRLDYPKGVIVNFAPESEENFYQFKQAKHHHLLGLQYLPIRSDFLNIKASKSQQIFIMLGGSDVANLSVEIVDSLKAFSLKKVIVSNDETISQVLEKHQDVTVLYKPSDTQLAQSMSSSVIAISTASMGAYELGYFKVPTILIAVAKNQEDGVSQFIEHHISSDFVSISDDSWKEEIAIKVKDMLNGRQHGLDNVIDGNGTRNIAKKILELL